MAGDPLLDMFAQEADGEPFSVDPDIPPADLQALSAGGYTAPDGTAFGQGADLNKALAIANEGADAIAEAEFSGVEGIDGLLQVLNQRASALREAGSLKKSEYSEALNKLLAGNPTDPAETVGIILASALPAIVGAAIGGKKGALAGLAAGGQAGIGGLKVAAEEDKNKQMINLLQAQSLKDEAKDLEDRAFKLDDFKTETEIDLEKDRIRQEQETELEAIKQRTRLAVVQARATGDYFGFGGAEQEILKKVSMGEDLTEEEEGIRTANKELFDATEKVYGRQIRQSGLEDTQNRFETKRKDKVAEAQIPGLKTVPGALPGTSAIKEARQIKTELNRGLNAISMISDTDGRAFFGAERAEQAIAASHLLTASRRSTGVGARLDKGERGTMQGLAIADPDVEGVGAVLKAWITKGTLKENAAILRKGFLRDSAARLAAKGKYIPDPGGKLQKEIGLYSTEIGKDLLDAGANIFEQAPGEVLKWGQGADVVTYVVQDDGSMKKVD